MNSGPLIYSTITGLVFGSAAGLVVGHGVWLGAAALGIAAGFLFARKPMSLLAAVCLSAAALGMFRSEAVLVREASATLSLWYGAPVLISGVVADDIDTRENHLNLTLTVREINGEPAEGKVLARVPRDEEAEFGDTVRVKGVLEEPEAFEGNGGRVFDYPGYLRVRGISGIVSRGEIVERKEGSASLRKGLFSIKHRFESALSRSFTEPQGALLGGVLLGERRGLPEDVTNAFIRSSLVHVVVLSGYNITIVSEAVLRSLSFLPPLLRYSVGGVAMVLFAILTGGGATTVRALFMGLIGVAARYFHRPAAALRALALAAGAMILWNPLSLLYDTSFILSIVATFGLITLSPAVEARLVQLSVFRLGRFKGLRSIAASTIAVQIFILPALLYFTGNLSFTALPANMLALPVVPTAMLLGFLAGLLAIFSPALALIPAAGAHTLLSWMILVAGTASSIPYGAVVIPAFPAWIVFLAYIPLSWFALRIYVTNPEVVMKATK